MPKQIHSRCGFTLIELLVVVSIIALLIALLLPALSAARDSARTIQCTTNTRQIAIAWTMYLDEHDEVFPPLKGHTHWLYGGKQPAIARGDHLLKERPLNPYVGLNKTKSKGLETFRCTADRDIRNGQTGGPGPTNGHTTYDFYGNSYMMNHQLLWKEHPETRQLIQRKLNEVRLPLSQVVASGDVQWYYAVNDTHWDGHFHNDHDQVNLSFLDGHAEYVQIVRGEGFTDAYSFRLDRPIGEEE